MTATDAVHILFGAALVAIGVLASALADRIRGLRIARESARERTGRHQSAPPAIPVVDPSELLRAAPGPKPRAARPETKDASNVGEDVITALVAAGYKKAIATEAAWACNLTERSTIESWTAAALRRCGRGAA